MLYQQADVIAYLVEENRVLKEQLRGPRLRLTDDQRRRLAIKAKHLGRQALKRLATIVTPDRLMRWQKRLLARKWAYPATKRVGRPGLMKSIKEMIVTVAAANPSWGRCRIQGELRKVGHQVCTSTVSNVLKENGIPLAPQRPSSWRSFIQAHWGHVVATDFFSVDVWIP